MTWLAVRSDLPAKICLYVQTAPSGTPGGAVSSLIGICEHIRETGWEPHVAATAGSALVDLLRQRGIPVTPMPMERLSFGSPLRACRQLWSWYRLLTKLRPRLIHENTFDESLAFSFLPTLLGIPYISHVRFPPSWEGVAHVLARVPSPRAVIFNSEAMRRRAGAIFNELAPAARQYVLHNALDLGAFRAAPPGSPPLVVGMIANLARYKGHRVFIRMAARVAREHRDVRFVIAGGVVDDPREPARLHRWVRRLGLAGRMELLGHQDDVAMLLRGLHVLVHPARFEAFGRVLIEAMAVGRPVVASAEGGPLEIVQDGVTGFLVPAWDVERFANRVLSLLRDDALRSRMGAAAAALARDRFSLRAHVRALARIYDEVVEGTGKSSAVCGG